MLDLVAYVDGGSLGNPGPSGIGVVIEGCADGTIRIARWIGRQDNNVAEYVALLEALQCALALKARALHVYSDSQVVVRQMRGEYACRSSRLYSLHWICRKLTRSLKFSITHVPRERNAEANGLANSAVRQQLSSRTATPSFCSLFSLINPACSSRVSTCSETLRHFQPFNRVAVCFASRTHGAILRGLSSKKESLLLANFSAIEPG